MIWGILTLIFGIGGIIMFTQPAYGIYNFNGESPDAQFLKQNLFDLIKFEKGMTGYEIAGSVFLILALVFVGIMLLLTLFNLIAKAVNNKSYVGSKLAAGGFFVCMLVATIMFAVHAAVDLMGADIWQALVEEGVVFSIGWGMIVALGCSILALIFAPRKNK